MIELYTANTPNGWKVSILLEELGLAYEVIPVALDTFEQRKPWFERINPNAKIPAIVDTDAGNFKVFESGAILFYLAEREGRFLPADARGRSEVLQWVMFQMAHIGPFQGQAHHFYRYAPEKIPYAIDRYVGETKRLYGVLDRRLREREYLAGDYTIADMATWPWVKVHSWAGIENLEEFPALSRWIDRLAERPAVLRGCMVPGMDANAAAGLARRVRGGQS